MIAGAYDVVVAAGVEVMTRVPMGASMADGKFGYPFGPKVGARYADQGGLVPQGISAELIADKWGITREDMDALRRPEPAAGARATDEGRFEREILPVLGADGAMMTADEGLRETTMESLAKLKPSFRPRRTAAGHRRQLVADHRRRGGAADHERGEGGRARPAPRARFVDFALAGADPRLMLTGADPGDRQGARAGQGLTIDDIDLVEINEAFASVVLAWEKELHPDMEKVNPNGGAIALGHPLGCSGARLMTTLLNELERTGGRYGLQTMCEGGGMANATIIERLG